MRRLTIFFLLVIFSGTMPASPSFMVSMENGRAYTESYNLSHILKTACPTHSNNVLVGQYGLDPSCSLSHRHIQLQRSIIPEKTIDLPGAEIFNPAQTVSPSIFFLTRFPEAGPVIKPSDTGTRLKMPLSPLQQTSQLLI